MEKLSYTDFRKLYIEEAKKLKNILGEMYEPISEQRIYEIFIAIVICREWDIEQSERRTKQRK